MSTREAISGYNRKIITISSRVVIVMVKALLTLLMSLKRLLLSAPVVKPHDISNYTQSSYFILLLYNCCM